VRVDSWQVGSLPEKDLLLFILGFFSVGPKTSVLDGDLSAH
jgi:hypothetical protein